MMEGAMENRQDDLGNDDLPRPGTEEPDAGEQAADGDAGSGPGNVSVDEPTAGALDDAGTPGGETGESDRPSGDTGEDEADESSEDTSEDGSEE